MFPENVHVPSRLLLELNRDQTAAGEVLGNHVPCQRGVLNTFKPSRQPAAEGCRRFIPKVETALPTLKFDAPPQRITRVELDKSETPHLGNTKQ